MVKSLLVGTKTVLDMAKTLRNLVAFVHLSTAFCHVDQEELCEHVYESPYNPHDVIKLVNWLDEKSLKLITSKGAVVPGWQQNNAGIRLIVHYTTRGET
ncbi:hypothetical protein TSAR_010944 [Trichomalopsis sarcophagae]|uniref:Thioester reductase (TE) domain-containing protein n=1 Tax=Trichomalopsis sarcophagae TaxID=543379 RepID=A0A232FD24_9HYME|nr:hypothetical protein TSAR_010944 [Trichomalopsis sarcophagae]